jgi:hypothetical protein
MVSFGHADALANPLCAVVQKDVFWIDPPDEIMNGWIVNRPHQ